MEFVSKQKEWLCHSERSEESILKRRLFACHFVATLRVTAIAFYTFSMALSKVVAIFNCILRNFSQYKKASRKSKGFVQAHFTTEFNGTNVLLERDRR
jgi:hypothetical protein